MEFSKSLKYTVLAPIVAVLFSACSTVEVHRVGTMLAARPLGAPNEKLTPKTQFTASDVIHYAVTFTWDDLTKPAGYHLVNVNWYKDGHLASTKTGQVFFGHAPFTFHDSQRALALGGGDFQVKVKVDSVEVAKDDFVIRW